MITSKYTHEEKLKFAARMRRCPTPAEKLFKEALRDCGVTGFRSQVLVMGWILDFYHARCGLAVEIDGETHKRRRVDDLHRDTVLAEEGIYTLRISNGMVYENCSDAIRNVRQHLRMFDGRSKELAKLNEEIARANRWSRGGRQ